MISVIIPTYNRASLLKKAVESVLQQQDVELELLVVDDGSTDDTASVMASIQDPRVRYLPQAENKGACAARNVGVREARGEYVAFQDSDDLWHLDKLNKQLAYLQKTGADIVFCAMNRHDELTGRTTFFPPEHTESREISYPDLLPYNLISTQTILGKRECFLETPFDESFPRLQDWELVLRIAQKYRIWYDATPLVEAYVQNDSISRNPQKGLWAVTRLIEQHHEALIQHPHAAIRLAETYAHFARLCHINPWPEYLRLLPRSPLRAVVKSVLMQVARVILRRP